MLRFTYPIYQCASKKERFINEIQYNKMISLCLRETKNANIIFYFTSSNIYATKYENEIKAVLSIPSNSTNFCF